MEIIARGATDIGRRRNLNEDSYGVFEELGLFVVADGMGGHAAGEVASQAAVEAVRRFVEETSHGAEIAWPFEMDLGLSPCANRLAAGIRLANREIHARAQENPEQRGMGTTVVAAFLCEGTVYFAHVGDSRAYALSGGALSRLTTDHSYVEEMVLAGHLTPEQARVHPLRNIVTRALGTREDVKVDVSFAVPSPGDVYLLCSDGLTGMLTDHEIEALVLEHRENPAAAVGALIARANQKGGDDNITAVLVRVT